jgi:3-methyl-2-oxobutanoate hydroxymethyltransferase
VAGQKLAVVTAYDATFARLVDAAGVDAVLVGDSVGMVVQGRETTLAVTLDEMVYHTRAVARGLRRAHLIADLPFMSYQVSVEEGLRSAGRLLKEGGAESVKLEGGAEWADWVARFTRSGIPTIGHIGLMPQSVHAMGGYKVQGRDEDAARRLREDARALEQAGAVALLLEGIPGELAATITAERSVPTIGIGAGPHCSGQVLVVHDLLGLDERFVPRFVKQYERLAERVRGAVEAYGDDVRSGRFPGPEHTFAAVTSGPSRSCGAPQVEEPTVEASTPP